jgi:ATP adenylyltransferase
MGIKTKTKNNQSAIKLDQLKIDRQIWPIERDVFFRPARLKYVRKLTKPKDCVFCTSAQKLQSEKTLCVYRTKYSQVVINKFPYNSGHILVLPLRHCGDLLSLTDIEFTDLQQTFKIAVSAIKAVYQPHGFNMGMNQGMAGGAGIPDHLHYHIVPRWNGDLNFFPLIAETKLVIEETKITYKKLNKYFKKIQKKEIE